MSQIKEIDLNNINYVYEIAKCATWIRENNFQKVCLQFPDHLLNDSTKIALILQELLDQNVFVLGDTAYESCCIDYAAAAHVNADCIIHFGPVCSSQTTGNIPYLNIYEKYKIDIDKLKTCFDKQFLSNNDDFIIIVDTNYLYCFEQIATEFSANKNVNILRIDDDYTLAANQKVIFIGQNIKTMTNIGINYKLTNLYYYDTTKETANINLFQVPERILKRRNFIIEKIRDANTIGIVIGTLAVKNYLNVINRMKKLIELSGKKYYVISVGKPTVAKLANFPEFDIYVIISCSMNKIYDEERDFYRPIVTPFDVEMALNSNTSISQFSYDYNRYLKDIDNMNTIDIKTQSDFSLISGKIRTSTNDYISRKLKNKNDEIALKTDSSLSIINENCGAGYLNNRSWKGLEENLGQNDVNLAVDGRKGIAQGYENEPQ